MKKFLISTWLALSVIGLSVAAILVTPPEKIWNSVITVKNAVSEMTGVQDKITSEMTADQGQLLQAAYDIAKEDGHKNPEVVQSVLLQETLAGQLKSFRVANPGPNAYFGLMQIKLAAAKDIIKQNPELLDKFNIQSKSDDEIKANLILNDKFNIEIASKYLLLLQNKYGYSGRRLLNAYNRGPSGVQSVGDDYHYALQAETKLAAYKRGG